MLLFKDREHYQEGAQNADIVEMRFEFYEKRRIGLIETVKQRRREIELRAANANESMSTRVAWRSEPLNLANPLGGQLQSIGKRTGGPLSEIAPSESL